MLSGNAAYTKNVLCVINDMRDMLLSELDGVIGTTVVGCCDNDWNIHALLSSKVRYESVRFFFKTMDGDDGKSEL